ncbi:kinase-like domain, phloem protein 2-like protein [Tanacetum coccineum]
MLSPGTEYVCYIVFKISNICQGLHYPVKVLDLLHHGNESEFFYFITPSALNINDITRVPKQREDGWMEIQLWKFNSAHELENDSHSVNMKFTSQEGNLSGLIVCGLEFRPLTVLTALQFCIPLKAWACPYLLCNLMFVKPAEGYVLKYADKLDESVNWTENKDLDGYRAVRMVNDIKLNDDAFNGQRYYFVGMEETLSKGGPWSLTEIASC